MLTGVWTRPIFRCRRTVQRRGLTTRPDYASSPPPRFLSAALPVKFLTVKSRLLLVLLVVGSLSCLLLGFIADVSCRTALRTRVIEQLTSVRESRTTQVETYVRNMRRHLKSLTEDAMVVDALAAFREATADERMVLTERQNQQLIDFYTGSFLPNFTETDGVRPVLANYLPNADSGRYLQYHYVLPAQSGEPATGDSAPAAAALVADSIDADSLGSGALGANALGTDALGTDALGTDALGADVRDADELGAADPTGYAAAVRTYDRPLRSAAGVFGYYDLFLVDPDSMQVVYSVAKEVDLGTSLLDGPYSNSSLAAAVREAVESPDRGFVAISDFQFYRPSKGAPAAFLAAPVYSETEKVGVIALQFPVDEINRIMTGDRRWRQIGLGQTGEAFLVGGDQTMRSDARGLLEAPREYLAELAQTRLGDEVVERIERFGTTILLRPIDHGAVEEALAGNSGTQTVRHLNGHDSLCSFGPVDIDGLDWGLITQMDLEEAFATLRDLRRTLVLSSTALLLLTTLLAMFFSSSLTRPIDRFARQAERVVEGTSDRFVVSSSDEFGRLGRAINNVVLGLRSQTERAEDRAKRMRVLAMRALPEHEIDRLGTDADAEAEPVGFSPGRNVAVVFVRFRSPLHDTVGAAPNAAGPLDANSPAARLDEADAAGTAVRVSSDADDPGRLRQLDGLIRLVDGIVEQTRIEKVWSDGSRYLATCGVDVPRLDATKRAIAFACELLDGLRTFNLQHDTAIEAAIAIDQGDLLAGFLGSRNIRYDVWGPPVRAAEQIAGAAASGTIVVTEAVRQSLHELHPFEPVASGDANRLGEANRSGEAGRSGEPADVGEPHGPLFRLVGGGETGRPGGGGQ